MKITLSFVISIAIIIVGLIILREAWGLPLSSPTVAVGGPGTFPLAMTAAILFLSVCIALSELVKSYKASKDPSASAERVTILSLLEIEKKEDLYRVLIAIAVVVTYTFVVAPLGFLVATPLLLVASMWLFGVKKIIYYPIVAVSFTVLLYFLFQRILLISLP
ncbi:MAG: tripartite tricarboxylate transporter TctB family protein [Defluviitaleaceae bacterium]|nr:tripartite tricarboxylate transporter TctB family protein [Defluviitaleaceae bacterium]